MHHIAAFLLIGCTGYAAAFGVPPALAAARCSQPPRTARHPRVALRSRSADLGDVLVRPRARAQKRARTHARTHARARTHTHTHTHHLTTHIRGAPRSLRMVKRQEASLSLKGRRVTTRGRKLPKQCWLLCRARPLLWARMSRASSSPPVFR